MTKPDPASVVDNILNGVTKSPANAIARMPDLAKAIEHFLDLKRDKDPRVAGLSFEWFYTQKLRGAFNGPSINTARRFVREVLQRDVKTGQDT